jgi:hypothetical protein
VIGPDVAGTSHHPEARNANWPHPGVTGISVAIFVQPGASQLSCIDMTTLWHAMRPNGKTYGRQRQMA